MKIYWGVEKSNVRNRLNCVLAKFRADRSHPRGVNGRSIFSRFQCRMSCFERQMSRFERRTSRLNAERRVLNSEDPLASSPSKAVGGGTPAPAVFAGLN